MFLEDVKSIVKGNECFVSTAVMEFYCLLNVMNSYILKCMLT